MSSYELANLQKEYDVEVAKIALAEAQNAKSQVRLTRNAEGGMSYVYTADENKTNGAAQQLEDAIYNATKANDEWVRSIEDGMLQATQTFIEQLQVINTTIYDSEAERVAAMDELNAWYQGQMTFYGMQMDLTLNNNESLYKNHIETIKADYGTMDNYNASNLASFQKMYSEMYKSGNDFATSLKDTTLPAIKGSLLGDSDSLTAYVKTLSTNLGTLTTDKDGNYTGGKGLYGELAAAQKSYETFVIGSFEAAGLSIGDEGFTGNIKALAAKDGTAVTNLNQFQSYVSQYIGDGSGDTKGVKKIISEANEQIKTLQTNTDFTTARDKAVDYGTKVAEAMKTANEQLDYVNTALYNLIDYWDSVEQLEDLKKEIEVKITYTKSDIPLPEDDEFPVEDDEFPVEDYEEADKSLIGKWASLNSAEAKSKYTDFGYKNTDYAQIKSTKINKDTGKLQYLFDVNGKDKWIDADQVAIDKGRILVNDEKGKWEKNSQFESWTGSGYKYYKYDNETKKWYFTEEYDKNKKEKNKENDSWERIDDSEVFITNTDKAAHTKKDMQVFEKGKDYNDVWTNPKNSKEKAYLIKMEDGTRQWVWTTPKEAGFMSDWNGRIAWQNFSAAKKTRESRYQVGDYVDIKGGNYSYGYRDYKNTNSSNDITVWNLSYEFQNDEYSENYELLNGKILDIGYVDGKYFYKLKYRQGNGAQGDIWLNGNQLSKFDTGGYTGEWGPEGRLAMLHQKEIVLNASDTENLLRTIDMVRSFNDRIEQSAKFAALGLSNIGGITSRIQGGDTLQQEVTIHAEFPNVSDHNEIETALRNLVNDASQYANRK